MGAIKVDGNGFIRQFHVNDTESKLYGWNDMLVLPIKSSAHGPQFSVSPRLLVLHNVVGLPTLGGLHDILEGEGFSVHLGADQKGKMANYVSLHNIAYHICDGNYNSIGVERISIAGKGVTGACTDIQMEAVCAVFMGIREWVSHHYGFLIPLKYERFQTPPREGLAGHIDGGTAWGNHNNGIKYAPAPGYHSFKQVIAQMKKERPQTAHGHR